MKRNLKRVLCLCLTLAMACGASLMSASAVEGAEAEVPAFIASRPDDPAVIPEGLEIDWNHRYTYA